MAYEKSKIRVSIQGELITFARVDALDAELLTRPLISIKYGDLMEMAATAEAAGVSRLVVEIRAIPDCKDGVAGWRPVLCGQFVPGDLPEDHEDD